VHDAIAGDFDLPVVAPGDELPDHPEPGFPRMLAHARLLLCWRSDDYFEERRRLMSAERFTLD